MVSNCFFFISFASQFQFRIHLRLQLGLHYQIIGFIDLHVDKNKFFIENRILQFFRMPRAFEELLRIYIISLN